MCEICELIKNDPDKILLHEDGVFAAVHPQPSTVGHVIIFPEKHIESLTQVDDVTAAKMYELGKRFSSIVFDAMRAQGSNVLIHDGEDTSEQFRHIVMHVIPRHEGDPMDFTWEPKQVDPAELSKISDTLTQAPLAEPPKAEEKVMTDGGDGGSENYLIKQLNRMP